MSVGELVGFALHAESLHIPHHTSRERAFLHALRCLARIRLHDLNTREVKQDEFAEFAAVPTWRLAHSAVLEHILQHRPRWMLRAVGQMQRFNARLRQSNHNVARSAKHRTMRLPRAQAASAVLDDKGGESKSQAEPTYLIDSKPTTVSQLAQQLAKNALDSEW